MMYPLDIVLPDPSTGNPKPFLIFKTYKVEYNITKTLEHGATLDTCKPMLGFVLPMPNGGLEDSSSNSYSTESSVSGLMNQKAMGLADDAASTIGINNASARIGRLPDPKLTQVYMGTDTRKFSAEWQLIPQSVGESAAIAAILAYIKYAAAPDRSANTKIGILLQPYVFSIKFSNPLINAALKYDLMTLDNYSINYFAQGYASTYWDMMPKHISLSMSFTEFGIKTKKDWMPG